MSEPKVLTLAYRRAEGELSTGAFLLVCGTSEEPLVLEHFTKIAYVDMMKKLAKYLQEYSEARAAFQRTDRAGLLPVYLASDELELFRSDPATAIRQRIFPPQVVHIGVDKRKNEPRFAVPPLNAGYETLVHCFGDVVYARVKTSRDDGLELVECVGCGAWCPTARIDAERVAFRCVECATWMPLADFKPGLGWAGILVDDLLAYGATQFFLPRQWNMHGNWIKRHDLVALYDNYKKEKNECIP